MKNNYETLYRKQCEEHEKTFAELQKYRTEARNLRYSLLMEQKDHERTKGAIRKIIEQVGA